MGTSAISVWGDFCIMGGEVKAYGGNPGSSWAYANGTNAIECNAIHVSNKNGNFKGVYGEGSKGPRLLHNNTNPHPQRWDGIKNTGEFFPCVLLFTSLPT
jgi:hypothetical protein